LDNEKVFIELPSEAEVQAEIQTIIKRGLTSNKKKPVLLLTASIMGVLLLLGFAFPGYASQLPIIGGIFRNFDGYLRDYGPLQEYATEVNFVGQIGDNIIVTIEDAFFNGHMVTFTYRVESDHSLADNFQLAITNPQIWVNNVQMFDEFGWGTIHNPLQQIADYEYISVAGIVFHGFADLAETAEIRFDFGMLQVAFPVEQTDGTDILVINELLEYRGFSTEISNVIVSPISIILQYRLNEPVGYNEFFFYNDQSALITGGNMSHFSLIITDDLGNEIIPRGSGSGSSGLIYGFLDIATPLHPDATKIIITPTATISHTALAEGYIDIREVNIVTGIEQAIIDAGGTVEREEFTLGEIIIPLP